VNKHWETIERRLVDLGCVTEMQLNVGATEDALSNLEAHIGVQLPDSVKQFIFIHNGQKGFGLLLGQQFLSTDGIRREWDVWRSIDEEDMNEDCAEFMASEPAGFIKAMYTNRLWIPLTSDSGGNHLGLDFDPDNLGRVGQVIAFGRDEDTKRFIASDFSAFLDRCIAWLTSAVWNGEYLDGAA
jgi:cell wall assembly regulator SMI1